MDCCKTLYREQKEKVYRLLNVAIPKQLNNTTQRVVHPEDLMGSDDEDQNDDDAIYKACESPPSSANSPNLSTPSVQSTLSVSMMKKDGGNAGKSRQFQSGHPRSLSVHRTMNREQREQRRRIRRIDRQFDDCSYLPNVPMHYGLNLEQLQRDNDQLRREKQQLLDEMHQMRMIAPPIVHYAYPPQYAPYGYSGYVLPPPPPTMIRRRTLNGLHANRSNNAMMNDFEITGSSLPFIDHGNNIGVPLQFLHQNAP